MDDVLVTACHLNCCVDVSCYLTGWYTTGWYTTRNDVKVDSTSVGYKTAWRSWGSYKSGVQPQNQKKGRL